VTITETARPAIAHPAPTGPAPAGSGSLSGHGAADAQCARAAEGQDSPQASASPIPNIIAPAGSNASHGHPASDAQTMSAVAASVPGHGYRDIHRASAGDQAPAAAIVSLAPTGRTLLRDQPGHGQPLRETPAAAALAGTTPARDHSSCVAHGATVPGGNQRDSHRPDDNQTRCAVAVQGQPEANSEAAPSTAALLADPFLDMAAAVLDDLENVRIANENRLRQLTRTATDADGEERGFGLMPPGVCEADDKKLLDKLLAAVHAQVRSAREAGQPARRLPGWHPDVWNLCLIILSIKATEHEAVLNLCRLMRRHPLGPWLAAQKGIGEKQGARLLAAIGDPYIRPEIIRKDGALEPTRPRTVAELRSYCGFGDARKQRRQSRVKSNWNAAARKRAWLIAAQCIRYPDSPYRPVYDATKAKYAGAVHDQPCARCGPAGKPAPAGSDLSDGHKHARGIRAMAKAILRDLWREAKRIHTETPVSGQVSSEAHAPPAADGPEPPEGGSS